jgi:ankyrin repeat protein
MNIWEAIDLAKNDPQVLDKLIKENHINNLDEFRYDETPLMWAAGKGLTGIARLLIDNGADVNLPNADGNTALMLAAFGGHKNIVEHLLTNEKNKANVDQENATGNTALIWAVGKPDNKDVIELLLSNKADVNHQNQSEYNALMFTAQQGRLAYVKLLLNYAADPELKDKSKRTASMLAEHEHHKEIVEALGKHRDTSYSPGRGP